MKDILDACCGGKMFWFGKNNPNALFMDNRNIEEAVLCDGRTFRVMPDVVADFRDMPFPNDSFRLVIFDPPHFFRAGNESYMAIKYGKLNKETWAVDIKKGFDECWRVLKPGGTLIFKWSESQIPKSKIEPLYPAEPIFGDKRAKTHWIVFYKPEVI